MSSCARSRSSGSAAGRADSRATQRLATTTAVEHTDMPFCPETAGVADGVLSARSVPGNSWLYANDPALTPRLRQHPSEFSFVPRDFLSDLSARCSFSLPTAAASPDAPSALHAKDLSLVLAMRPAAALGEFSRALRCVPPTRAVNTNDGLQGSEPPGVLKSNRARAPCPEVDSGRCLLPAACHAATLSSVSQRSGVLTDRASGLVRAGLVELGVGLSQ